MSGGYPSGQGSMLGGAASGITQGMMMGLQLKRQRDRDLRTDLNNDRQSDMFDRQQSYYERHQKFLEDQAQRQQQGPQGPEGSGTPMQPPGPMSSAPASMAPQMPMTGQGQEPQSYSQRMRQLSTPVENEANEATDNEGAEPWEVSSLPGNPYEEPYNTGVHGQEPRRDIRRDSQGGATGGYGGPGVQSEDSRMSEMMRRSPIPRGNPSGRQPSPYGQPEGENPYREFRGTPQRQGRVHPDAYSTAVSGQEPPEDIRMDNQGGATAGYGGQGAGAMRQGRGAIEQNVTHKQRTSRMYGYDQMQQEKLKLIDRLKKKDAIMQTRDANKDWRPGEKEAMMAETEPDVQALEQLGGYQGHPEGMIEEQKGRIIRDTSLGYPGAQGQQPPMLGAAIDYLGNPKESERHHGGAELLRERFPSEQMPRQSPSYRPHAPRIPQSKNYGGYKPY